MTFRNSRPRMASQQSETFSPPGFGTRTATSYASIRKLPNRTFTPSDRRSYLSAMKPLLVGVGVGAFVGWGSKSYLAVALNSQHPEDAGLTTYWERVGRSWW